ncbi:MAG: tetratricopeptide repeat protein, partial [Gemmatimonadetes bacterium]|nr:tetratricopeptide repeat protein [Gemmatimonadota bacterium]
PVIFGGEETAGQAWELEPDLASLRQQMRHVFTERSEAHRRGVRGMAHIHSHFTWADSAHKAQEALEALNKLPLTPDALPQAIKAAAIILGEAPTHETDAALELIVGAHARYSVSLEDEHVLGEQLDAIRSNVDEDVSLVFILAHDVEMDPADVRSLIAHFETVDRLGLLIPDRVSGVMGNDIAEVSISAIVDSPCVVLRASALAEVGGFDVGFASIAVLANLARALRRRDWKIQAAEEVVVEDPADEETVALTAGWAATDLCGREVAAVAALEEGDRRRTGGDTEGAIECYERSLAAKEDFVEVLLVLADACLDAGRPTDAAAVAARLTNIDPTSAWAQNFSALVHARAGDTEAARTGFATAVELNPDLAEARVNLAVMAWEAGETDTALEHFRHASDLDPFNRDLICNLGLIYTQTGDTREAVDLYLAYLAQVPEDVEVLGRLAEVQLLRQEDADARATAARLLQIDPEHARARSILQQRAESG